MMSRTHTHKQDVVRTGQEEVEDSYRASYLAFLNMSLACSLTALMLEAIYRHYCYVVVETSQLRSFLLWILC